MKSFSAIPGAELLAGQQNMLAVGSPAMLAADYCACRRWAGGADDGQPHERCGEFERHSKAGPSCMLRSTTIIFLRVWRNWWGLKLPFSPKSLVVRGS